MSKPKRGRVTPSVRPVTELVRRLCLRCGSGYSIRPPRAGAGPILYCHSCVQRAWRISDRAAAAHPPIVWNHDHTQGTCPFPVWFVTPGRAWPARAEVDAATDALADLG